MAEFKLVDVVKRRRELDAEYARAKQALKDQYEPKLDAIDKYLMKYLIDNKQKTVATEAGTVMTYQRRNVKMTDLAQLSAWCTLHNKGEFIKQAVDSTEVLAYLDADSTRGLPNGLTMDATNVLAVKAPK